MGCGQVKSSPNRFIKENEVTPIKHGELETCDPVFELRPEPGTHEKTKIDVAAPIFQPPGSPLVVEDISDPAPIVTAVQLASPRSVLNSDGHSSASLEHSTLTERISKLEDTCRSQAAVINEMQQLLISLQKDANCTVSVLQYNILASYLGKNTQPWFLYGIDITPELRKKILTKYNERDAQGVPKFSWPAYAEGLLSPQEIHRVEEADKDFHWDVRKLRLTQVIEDYDADVVSLVELDQYDYFSQSLGTIWDSVFHKRPRDASLDGCGVFWRRAKFVKECSQAWDFVDTLDQKGRARRDRSCLIVLLRWRSCGAPLVVVSTHLARNPEDRAQTAIRVRQVTQLVEWLTEFTNTNQVSDSPVILLGDLNASHFGEIRGIARTVWQIKGDPMHNFMWSAADVPTGPTSITKARQVRIDIVQYTNSQLEVMDVRPVPKLPKGAVIPNEDHPSDHFPVCARFVLKNSYQKHKAYARAWLECVAGFEKLHPLTEKELVMAYEFFDRDRSGQIHRHDLEEACLEMDKSASTEVQRLLLDCFPDKQISYYNFVKAYEVRLSSERLRCVGELESAFKFLAEEAELDCKFLETLSDPGSPHVLTPEELQKMCMACRCSNLCDIGSASQQLARELGGFDKVQEMIEQALGKDSWAKVVSEWEKRKDAGTIRIQMSTLEAAFRQITPISFTDDEVREMLCRLSRKKDSGFARQVTPVLMTQDDLENTYVDLHKFCEVVCQATFPHRDRRRGSIMTPTFSKGPAIAPGERPQVRSSTKELCNRLQRFHSALNLGQPQLPQRISALPLNDEQPFALMGSVREEPKLENQPSLVHEDTNMASVRYHNRLT